MPAGASEEQIKELITKENYARYLKMTAPMSAIQVKADFSLKEVARQQGLSVSRDAVEDERACSGVNLSLISVRMTFN